ncbi:uncharacterized protein K452DRAFT_60991 [Aplosporella prunicola CBS 121167]|uniref:Uncharacterized protein n=1 Tax=Aplosporella prunicola CBS 121167 TaxID=1176127 RepID=A0A6A6AWF8_9PEZI|nr:uncharacterized protein K452DRAFT_60991 [Aplosporella prunicola CBS 121167]KAF2135147.1 hypothetical protein K452DRAFT_60991 [Aplosporella prunicola CBS 121167]
MRDRYVGQAAGPVTPNGAHRRQAAGGSVAAVMRSAQMWGLGRLLLPVCCLSAFAGGLASCCAGEYYLFLRLHTCGRPLHHASGVQSGTRMSAAYASWRWTGDGACGAGWLPRSSPRRTSGASTSPRLLGHVVRPSKSICFCFECLFALPVQVALTYAALTYST